MWRRSALCGAAIGGLVLVGLPATPAAADYYDFQTGRFVCTSYQCLIGTALSRGDVYAATQAAQRQRELAAQQQNAAARRVAESYVRVIEQAGGGGAATPSGDAASDAYAQQMNEYYAALEAWQGSVSTPKPSMPDSPYNDECIASTPDIVVTYSSRMPTFDILGECIGTVYIKWGYTQGGIADPYPSTLYGGEGYDADYHGEIWDGQPFTPPFPANPEDDGVWLWALNHVGEVGPYHPGDSIGYAGWYPRNNADGSLNSSPNVPIAILPKTPAELNAERAAALAEQAAASAVTPAARITKGRMTVTGKPNTDYIVVARKGKKIRGSWTVTTNARGVGKLTGVAAPKKVRLLVTEAPQ